jgi:alpha-D-xyloside xylohydrolase
VKLIIAWIIIAPVFSCSSGSFEETEDGVIVTRAQRDDAEPLLVRIQVLDEEIIRVSATPESEFPDRNSLIILDQDREKVPHSVEELEGSVVVSTDKIKATVSLKTGSVKFADKEGNVILQEVAGGGKSFSPIEVEGSSGYSFRQVFESPEDEAFYGLGQHQSDEWNYKGKNEILYQYNTKISVPFVVSSRNYGILWDNYSLTKFGDVRDYGELSQFKLYNALGEEGGLTASYVTAEGETFVQRDESSIDYENLTTISNFPEEFPFWQSTITWEGELEAAQSGEYEFKLYYAGYTTVHIDGEEVVEERWRTAWNPNTYKFRVELEAGERIPVKLHWRPDGGVSYIGLKALGPLDPVEQGRLSLWSEMGQELDYYFIRGEDMDGVISGYRSITGKAQIMPQWAYGFWQSRERYRTQDEIVRTLSEFRRRGIGIDNIVQDWFYWRENQWGSHEFDPERFPDPEKMVRDIHNMNAHIMISVWPKFYHNTGHFKEFDQNGWMYRLAVEDSIRDWVGSGYIGSFYDAYAEGARILFWEQMNEHLFSLGIDAWWMDASEPDILSNASLEYRKKLSGPTALGPSTEFLNTYSLVNAEAIYAGQRKVAPNQRVYLLTRSGFAGLQRYSTASWSGDIGTRWEDMKAQISAGLNFALSGIPYWTMDIGGFCVEHRYVNAKEGSEDLEEWRELNTRWYQFGSFLPIYRAHGQFPYREAFHIAPDDHPAYRSIVRYNKMRYHLMPYIYSVGGQIHFDDYTLMRALVMDFPEDPEVKDIGDQFMFGPGLMVCPVYRYKAREREVRLPGSGGWYDIYSGKHMDGGQNRVVAAPYEQIPVYAKAGSIIPLGPEIQYVGEKPDAPVTIFVYGGADGSFTLYEDEGVNYNYERGAFSTIEFAYNDKEGSLIIGERKGSFEGMAENRQFNVVLVDQDKPLPLAYDVATDHSVNYSGNAITINF